MEVADDDTAGGLALLYAPAWSDISQDTPAWVLVDEGLARAPVPPPPARVYMSREHQTLLGPDPPDPPAAAPGGRRWAARGGVPPALEQELRRVLSENPVAAAEADAILPVPLHWRRLLARRYNQSALLGAAIARLSGVPMETGWLLRRRATPSQAGQSARSRKRNVAGAFHVPERSRVEGRRLVLVDDVFTTGATATACARTLKRAGAAHVSVMTLCRVVRSTDPTI